MKITLIQKAIAVLVISFFISPSVNSVHGQGFLKKLKDAAKKEVNKVISPTTPATTPSTNKGTNTNPTNPANTVNIASKDDAGSQSQQHKPEEINSSIQKNLKNIDVSLRGINDEQQMYFKKYLLDTAKGIYGVEKSSIGSDFIDLGVYTYLTKEELGKVLVEILKTINPKLFYKLDTANVYLLRMTVSDKPELNARDVVIRLKKGFYNDQKCSLKNT